MKKLHLIIFAGLLLASCVKEEETAPHQDNGTASQHPVSTTDPYKLSLVQEVLDEKLAETRSERIVLKPTHRYVSFHPCDSAQVALLESLPIDRFYRPIGEENYEIPEPDEDDTEVYDTVYSVVPVSLALPEAVEHRTIYEVYIQEFDGSVAASDSQLPEELFKSVLAEAMARSGYGNLTRTESSSEWNPSARFRLHIDLNSHLADTIPLNRLTVVAYQGSRREIRRTNAEGETGEFGKFIGHVDYQVNWDDEKFVIRQGNTWTRRTSPFRVTGNNVSIDTVITESNGLDYFLAGAYRGLVAYYYENYPLVEGLVKQRRSIEVGIVNKSTDKWRGRYIPGLKHPLSMYAKMQSDYHSSCAAMEGTLHELGHASHHYKKGTADYGYAYAFKRKEMESWANGVGYAYTKALLGDEYEWQGKTNKKYTRLVECLMLNGFSLQDIQFDFYGSDGWDHWKSRTLARNDLPIEREIVELIFDNPNTYHYDMRDLINVSDASPYKYQPSIFTLKHSPPFSVVSWEMVSGTGGHIIQNSAAGFVVYFTESGEKIVRATIKIADGIQKSYEKIIKVIDKDIISAPKKVRQNYEFTVNLIPSGQFQNASVVEWSSDEDGALTGKETATSAAYRFSEEGIKTLTAKIRFSPTAPIVKWEGEVNVEGVDAYTVFAVTDKPELFNYNTVYKAKYMGKGSQVKVTDIGLNHNTILPYYDFTTWSYNEYDRTITFSIPTKPAAFDYTLLIFYSVNGVAAKEPAKLVISNYRTHSQSSE